MTLESVQKQDYAITKKLYLSAFPADERAPFWLLKRRAMQGRATMLVAKEGNEFIGFAYLVDDRDLAYLFYFAVDERKRGNGNGSEILRLLKDKCADKKLFLAREPLDETADNYIQRVKRHEFYLRNGFKDLTCKIQEATIVYDVMSIGGAIVPTDYNALISDWQGKLMRSFIKMQMIP